MEIWKDVKCYEGIYQVSNLGKIKGIERKTSNGKGFYIKKEYILQQHKQRTGYLYVHVSQNNIGKTLMVHKIVGENFIEKIEGKKYLNHIDGNKLNNSVNNLEWVTAKENGEHAAKLFLKAYGENHPFSKLKEKDVLYIYNSFLNGIKTRQQLCTEFNVHLSSVYAITVKKSWKKLLLEA